MNTNKPLFLQLSKDDQRVAIEALIFASESPLSIDTLFNILIVGNKFHTNQMNHSIEQENKLNGDSPVAANENDNKLNGDAASFLESSIDYEALAKDKWEFSIGLFEELITEINIDLINTNRPFQIIKIGNGYQFCTRKEYGELIQHLTKSRTKRRFSNAALECLAIIAYRQPVTKPEIDQIRGVNSNEVVNSLVEKALIEPIAQKETIGRPWMFATTDEFLKAFGLNAIEDLPQLRELDEIVDMLNAENPEKDIVIDVSGETVQVETNDEQSINTDITESGPGNIDDSVETSDN